MPWSAPKASTTARGYGAAHQRERKRWAKLIEQGGVACCLCGRLIEPGSAWHLDHTPDRTTYRGAACAPCNVRDGAVRASARSRGLGDKVKRLPL